MQNKRYEKFIIIQAEIEANKQDMKSNKKDFDENITKFTEQFKGMLVTITDQIITLKSFPSQKDSQKPLEPINSVPTNRRAPSLNNGKSTKIGGL